jgi:hypothetical protein
MIDNFLLIPDAESRPLYRIILKLACFFQLHHSRAGFQLSNKEEDDHCPPEKDVPLPDSVNKTIQVAETGYFLIQWTLHAIHYQQFPSQFWWKLVPWKLQQTHRQDEVFPVIWPPVTVRSNFTYFSHFAATFAFVELLSYSVMNRHHHIVHNFNFFACVTAWLDECQSSIVCEHRESAQVLWHYWNLFKGLLPLQVVPVDKVVPVGNTLLLWGRRRGVDSRQLRRTKRAFIPPLAIWNALWSLFLQIQMYNMQWYALNLKYE